MKWIQIVKIKNATVILENSENSYLGDQKMVTEKKMQKWFFSWQKNYNFLFLLFCFFFWKIDKYYCCCCCDIILCWFLFFSSFSSSFYTSFSTISCYVIIYWFLIYFFPFVFVFSSFHYYYYYYYYCYYYYYLIVTDFVFLINLCIWIIVFTFIVIFTTFQLMHPSAFVRCF